MWAAIVALLGIIGTVLGYVVWRKQRVRTKVETALDIEKSLDHFKQSVRKAILENREWTWIGLVTACLTILYLLIGCEKPIPSLLQEERILSPSEYQCVCYGSSLDLEKFKLVGNAKFQQMTDWLAKCRMQMLIEEEMK